MGFEAKVILDSISPAGIRLTTIAATFPRFILAEMNTHRMFSRNTASSRAIPVEKMIQRVKDDPFIPESWPKNQPGMQAKENIEMHTEAWANWTWARDFAVEHAERLNELGVHKQIVNRLLEPFSWTTQLITATDWDNFFKLRCHPDAQPEMQKIATMIRDVRGVSIPKRLAYVEWHLPFVSYEELYSSYELTNFLLEQWKAISVARCARVSYLTHEGKRDIDKDLELYDRLLTSGHWSPFEHVATPLSSPKPSVQGNFTGWRQFRKEFENEDGTKKI